MLPMGRARDKFLRAQGKIALELRRKKHYIH
jgi:hypothetical protein